MDWKRQITGWFRGRNRRTYGLARDSNAGGSALPYVLYDDYYDHRDYVTAMSSSSFIGVLWSPEVRSCGSAEEWLHRIQSVCFSPMAMINAWADGSKAWSYPEVAQQVQEAAMLRMQLFPYLYTCFAQYYFEGKPPIRAMNLAEGFAYTQDVKDQFMLGDYLLVAPMFTGEKTRKLVLPAGNWYDFYTGNYAGSGEVIQITPGLDRIPLSVKDRAIIPIIPPVQHAPRAGESLPLEIRFYGEKPGSFRLYDDDGETFDYEKGNYAWYPLSVAKNKKGKWEGHTEAGTGNFLQRQYSDFTWKFMTTTTESTFLYVSPDPGNGPGSTKVASHILRESTLQNPFTSMATAKQAIRQIRKTLW